jgi:hypothetical protein
MSVSFTELKHGVKARTKIPRKTSRGVRTRYFFDAPGKAYSGETESRLIGHGMRRVAAPQYRRAAIIRQTLAKARLRRAC